METKLSQNESSTTLSMGMKAKEGKFLRGLCKLSSSPNPRFIGCPKIPTVVNVIHFAIFFHYECLMGNHYLNKIFVCLWVFSSKRIHEWVAGGEFTRNSFEAHNTSFLSFHSFSLAIRNFLFWFYERIEWSICWSHKSLFRCFSFSRWLVAFISVHFIFCMFQWRIWNVYREALRLESNMTFYLI